MAFKKSNLELEKLLPAKKASLRQIRVAELIKEVVAEIIAKQEIDAKVLLDNFITISAVKISPDLQNATIFISAFNASDIGELVNKLNILAPKFRAIINQHVKLKYSPQIIFRYDDTLDNASKVDQLLASLKE